MKMRISDDEVLNFLKGHNSLLDGKLTSLLICERNNLVAVELFLTARDGAEYSQLRLIFEHVTGFDFTYSKDYIFGNVEDLKFLITEDGQFYLSLDPDLSEKRASQEDRDFVRGKKLFAEVIYN